MGNSPSRSKHTQRPPRAKRGRWSKADLQLLQEQYGLRADAAIARDLKRSVHRVTRMAQSLFPPVVRRSGPWTANEVLELRRYLGASSAEVIARILGRSVTEVQTQILDLGRLRRVDSWSRAEIAELKRIFGSRTDEDLSLSFGRSVEEIRRFAAENGLSKDKGFMRRLHGAQATRMPRWSAAELEILRTSYPVEANLDLAKRLGRSVKSVVSKAHTLGLKKSAERLQEMGRTNVSVRYS